MQLSVSAARVFSRLLCTRRPSPFRGALGRPGERSRGRSRWERARPLATGPAASAARAPPSDRAAHTGTAAQPAAGSDTCNYLLVLKGRANRPPVRRGKARSFFIPPCHKSLQFQLLPLPLISNCFQTFECFPSCPLLIRYFASVFYRNPSSLGHQTSLFLFFPTVLGANRSGDRGASF